jgi:nucleotide-sensitive chloride channel 1A
LDDTPEGVDPESEEIVDIRELKIIPDDQLTLAPIFEALSHCAALHPDLNDSNLDDDFDDAIVDGDGNQDDEDPDELDEVGKVRSDFVNNSRFAPY